MRSILNTAALEAYNGMATQYGNLSREEEEVMAADAEEAAGEAATGLDESERMLGLADGLEDLAEIADGITEATQTETDLLTVAGNMAVAGSEVAPEEIVPAMEGFVGRKIATESFRERAAAIWRAILAQIKKVWAWIEKFFYNIFGTIPGLRKELKALRARVEDTAGKKLEDKKITISSGVKAVSLDGSVPKTDGDLTKGMSNLLETVTWVYGPHMDALASLGDVMADKIGDFDADKPQESAAAFLTATGTKSSKMGEHCKSAASGGRFSGYNASVSHALPGNVSLFFKSPKAETLRAHANETLAKLDGARHYGLELLSSSEKDKDVPDSFEMTTPAMATMHTLIDDMEKVLDKLEDFNRGKRTSDMKKTRAKLETASAKATKAVEKAEKSDEAADRTTIVYYRAMLNFNQAYARWCQNPGVQLVQASLSSIRGYKAVIAKTLSAYK